MTPWLSPSEVDDLCDPLTQAAAQVRYLRDELGLAVKTKPNGRPLVLRSSVEAVLGPLRQEKRASGPPNASAPHRQPNESALVLAFQHRK